MDIKDENKTKIISKEFIEKFVYYDETSPSCLRWKSNTRKQNKQAGGKSKVNIGKGKDGYIRWRIQIGNTKYIVARLIMILHNHDVVNFYVDHKDGNPLNNQIDNLRCVSREINTRNSVQKNQNKAGVVGVKLVKYLGELSSFMVRWRENGVMKHKSFNVKEHGEIEAKLLATNYRKMKLLELNSQGYGYSDRHINQVLSNG